MKHEKESSNPIIKSPKELSQEKGIHSLLPVKERAEFSLELRAMVAPPYTNPQSLATARATLQPGCNPLYSSEAPTLPPWKNTH